MSSLIEVLEWQICDIRMVVLQTHSIWGQSRRFGLLGKAVQLSPAFAKLVMGGLMPFMKARGMIYSLSVNYTQVTDWNSQTYINIGI
jgi:hypothetical protein